MSTAKPRKSKKPDFGAVQHLTREKLAEPRPLTPQVLGHLLSQHEVASDQVTSWLRENLPQLEPYELDLLLSPLFTPGLEQRLCFEEVLGDSSLSEAEVDELLETTQQSDVKITLLHESEQIESPLPEVVLERFVRMLHLESEVPRPALDRFGTMTAEARCHLRDEVWKKRRNTELLPSLLTAVERIGSDFPGYVHFLTDFVRTHRPSRLEECVTFLDNLAEAYEDDLRKHNSGTRSFFSEELQASHAGRWRVDETVVDTHKRMITMARTVREMLV